MHFCRKTPFPAIAIDLPLQGNNVFRSFPPYPPPPSLQLQSLLSCTGSSLSIGQFFHLFLSYHRHMIVRLQVHRSSRLLSELLTYSPTVQLSSESSTSSCHDTTAAHVILSLPTYLRPMHDSIQKTRTAKGKRSLNNNKIIVTASS